MQLGELIPGHLLGGRDPVQVEADRVHLAVQLHDEVLDPAELVEDRCKFRHLTTPRR